MIMRWQSTQGMSAHSPQVLLHVSVRHNLMLLIEPLGWMLQSVGPTDHWRTEMSTTTPMHIKRNQNEEQKNESLIE